MNFIHDIFFVFPPIKQFMSCGANIYIYGHTLMNSKIIVGRIFPREYKIYNILSSICLSSIGLIIKKFVL